MQFFTFASCRRSGCHPIAQWVGGLWPDYEVAYCHNNAGYVTDYMAEGRILPLGQLLKDVSAPPTSHELSAAPEPESESDEQEDADPSSHSPPTNLLDASHTESPPEVTYAPGEFPESGVVIFGSENRVPRQVGLSMPFTRPILNLRDPFNMWASVVQYSRKADKAFAEQHNAGPQQMRQRPIQFLIPAEHLSRVWCACAKEFLGETNFLGDTAIKINYNEWHSDVNYRRSLATEEFGRPFDDRGKDNIPVHGAGSSFDGREKKDRDYLNRWIAVFQDERFYRVIRANLDLFEYAERIWPELTHDVARAVNVENR